MFNRSLILAGLATLIGVCGSTNSANAFPSTSSLQRQAALQQQQMQRQAAQQQHRFYQLLQSMQRQAAQQQRNSNTASKKKVKTPTQMVLENLQAAQGELARKDTSNATKQLQGSENILSNWSKYPANGDKNNAATVEAALKSVRDARSSLNSKKVDDATTSIGDAITSLKGSNGNNKKKNNNNNN